MRDSTDLPQLLCGVLSPEAYATRHGLTLEQTLALRDEAMGRLAEVLAPRRTARSPWFLAAVVGVLLALVPTSALAQLVTFVADQPARADQVNANFQQLKTWLELKVGPVGNNAIATGSTGSVSTGSLSTGTLSTGSISANSANVTGGLVTGGLTVSGTSSVASLGVSGALNVAGTFTANGTLNSVNIRPKGGNNGTLNCDAYCNNSGFGGFGGSCLGAKLPSGQYTADCSFQPGLLPGGQSLVCLCATY